MSDDHHNTTIDMAVKEASRRRAWRSVCAAHAVRCVADRSWSFFLPLYLSRGCKGSLRPTAAFSLTQNLAVAMLSAAAADLYQSIQRSNGGLSAFVRATILENCAVVLGGLLLVAFATQTNQSADLCSGPLQSGIYVMALLCGATDAVCSSLLSTILSKQWVATLYHNKGGKTDDPKEGGNTDLSGANATLSQIDLVAATICPLLVSSIIRYGGGYTVVLTVLVSQHALGAVLIVTNASRALRLQPELAGVAKKDDSARAVQWNPFSVFVDPAVPLKAKVVMTAFVLLFCTVLSPGSVMNAWLNSIRDDEDPIVSEETIALFGSTSNLFGALATLLTPPLIRWFGIYKAGTTAQFFQTSCVVCAVASFFQFSDSSKSGQLLVWGFLFPIAISRVGLWGFDLVERQILQERVPAERQTVFFNAERGWTQLISLGMMYLCYVFAEPSSFSILVGVSATAVVSSSILLALSSAL